MNPLVYGLAALALLAALIFGISEWEDKHRRDGAAAANAQHEADAVAEGKRQLHITEQRFKQQQEAKDADDKRVAKSRADARIAGADRDRVQRLLDEELNKRVPSADPAVVSERKARDVVGKLFSQCVAEYTVLGESADRSRDAGKLCEQSYDALKVDGDAATAELMKYVTSLPSIQKEKTP